MTKSEAKKIVRLLLKEDEDRLQMILTIVDAIEEIAETPCDSAETVIVERVDRRWDLPHVFYVHDDSGTAGREYW